MHSTDLLVEPGKLRADRIDPHQPLRVCLDPRVFGQLVVDETFDQGDTIQRFVHEVATRPEAVEFVVGHDTQSGRIVGMDENRLRTELQLIDDVLRTTLQIAVNVTLRPRTRIDAWMSVHDWLDRRNRLLGLPSCG